MPYKPLSDSTLRKKTKAEIVELLRVAEHNFEVTQEKCNNQFEYGKKLIEENDKLKAEINDLKRLLKGANKGINKLMNDKSASPCNFCTNVYNGCVKTEDGCNGEWIFSKEVEKLTGGEEQ